MRDDESSLGVVGAIECVREKERTPGGISRIIYLKWQRRFREPKPHEDRVLIAVSRASGAFNSFPFFFFASVPFQCTTPESRALFDPAPHLLHSAWVTATPPALRVRPALSTCKIHPHIISAFTSTLRYPCPHLLPSPANSRFFPNFIPYFIISFPLNVKYLQDRFSAV